MGRFAGTGTGNLSPDPRDVLEVVRRLRRAGHDAYVVGGYVRDRLLGRRPKDCDVATSAPPGEVESLFPRSRAVGQQFGVILVREGETMVEVATFRSESGYSDGRRPDSVRFAGILEDAARRDFTINALYWDPEGERVVDPLGVGGDLGARLLRTVGDPDERFREDHLRLVRAVRLAVTLGFELEPCTLASVRANAHLVLKVPAERVREELRRCLVHPRRAEAVRLMERAGLLGRLLPEVEALHGVPQPAQYHPEGDVYVHTLLALDHLPGPCTFTLALATLLHDIGKPATYEEAGDRIRFHGHAGLGAEMSVAVARRLRLSREERERVVWLVGKHLAFLEAHRMRRSTLRRYLGHPGFDELHALHRADVLASGGDLAGWRTVEEARCEFEDRPARPEPLVTGTDLIALGLSPGPVLGEILRELETAQLEDRLSDRDEALGLARSLARERGLLPGPDSPHGAGED